MRDEIMCRLDEDGSLSLYEPYATVECETKEDYDNLVELFELGKSVVRCKDCKHEENCMKQILLWKRDHLLEQNVYHYGKLEFCSRGERRADNG